MKTRIPTIQPFPINPDSLRLKEAEMLAVERIRIAAVKYESIKSRGLAFWGDRAKIEGPIDFWAEALPEVVGSILDSIQQEAAIAAAVGFLRLHGIEVQSGNHGPWKISETEVELRPQYSRKEKA